MRYFDLIFLFIAGFAPLTAQQFTLPEPPDFLRTPYAYPHVEPSVDSLPKTFGMSNEGLTLFIPEPLLDQRELLAEDVARHAALMPLRDYLQTTSVSDPRKENYNGPEKILKSGYRLRLRQDQHWQLFSPKLRPEGDPFDQLPDNQPFENSYLACDQFSCRLMNDGGKPINWAEDYDLLQFTTQGDLVYFEDGHLGLLSGDGKKLVSPFATSIYTPKDVEPNSYELRYGERSEHGSYKTLSFLRGENILWNDSFRGTLREGRFIHNWHNVLDSELQRWMLDPAGENFIRPINPDAGILALVEKNIQPGRYPTNKDSLEYRDWVVHLLNLSGEYLTSFWSEYGNFVYSPTEGSYSIIPDSAHLVNSSGQGQLFSDYNLDFEPIDDISSTEGPQYFGSDSLHFLIEDYGESFLLDRAGDTLLRLFCQVKYYPVGQDTLLITQRITWSDRPEGLEDVSYIYRISRKEVVDTLPHLTRLSVTGDFAGVRIHLDHELHSVNDEQRLLDGLTEQSKQSGYPYNEKVCCHSKRFYDYAGNPLVDDFGNELFRSIKPVGKSAMVLEPREHCCTELGYNVLRIAGSPDQKISPRLLQGYDIGTRDLLGFHFPRVYDNTRVMLKNGTGVLDSVNVFVRSYDDTKGILRVQFGQNFSDNEYLTFDGRFLIKGKVCKVEPQADDSFIVRIGDLYGLSNRQGEIFPPVFSSLRNVAGNVYVAKMPGNKQAYYVRGGKLLRGRF